MAALAASAACTTTTRLGPASDPETVRIVEEVAAQPGADARVATSAPAVQPIAGGQAPCAITAHGPGWLSISRFGSPERLSLAQISAVSNYDHVGGAIEGAIAAGTVGFVLGFGAGAALSLSSSCNAGAPCETSTNVPRVIVGGLIAGAIAGGVTALVGAGLGAIQGHERRYEIAAP